MTIGGIKHMMEMRYMVMIQLTDITQTPRHVVLDQVRGYLHKGQQHHWREERYCQRGGEGQVKYQGAGQGLARRDGGTWEGEGQGQGH